MFEEIQAAYETYDRKWQTLVASRQNKQFFEELKPVALGWKVADEAAYKSAVAELHGAADKIIETWMNERWVAKIHLKEQAVGDKIQIVKIMQRRPGSDDALGLDHVDFYSPAVTKAPDLLGAEKDLKWSTENNDIIAGYDWISIWFDGTEAKLKHDTVLDIICLELKELNSRIIA